MDQNSPNLRDAFLRPSATSKVGFGGICRPLGKTSEDIARALKEGKSKNKLFFLTKINTQKIVNMSEQIHQALVSLLDASLQHVFPLAVSLQLLPVTFA